MTKTHVAPFGSGDTDWQPVLTTPWYTMSRRGDWYSVMTSSGLHPATIFAVDAHDQVLLLEVYRPALDRVVIETPRGLVDEGETAREGAAREFSEETGISVRAEDLIPLGRIFPDSGILRSEIEVFGLRHAQAFAPVSADDAVILGHRLVPLSEMADMVASGEISDSITIASWQRFLAGQKPGRVAAYVDVEILDETDAVVSRLRTARPSWSFDEFTRNRDAVGWSWRICKS